MKTIKQQIADMPYHCETTTGVISNEKYYTSDGVEKAPKERGRIAREEAYIQIEYDIEKQNIVSKSADLTGDIMYVHGVQYGIDQVKSIARLALTTPLEDKE